MWIAIWTAVGVAIGNVHKWKCGDEACHRGLNKEWLRVSIGTENWAKAMMSESDYGHMVLQREGHELVLRNLNRRRSGWPRRQIPRRAGGHVLPKV